jgi:hypothetical protein
MKISHASEVRLAYDRRIVPQETGWWCGPASVQVALNAKNIHIPEREIAHDIEQLENPGRGDDRDGTDYIGLIEKYLDRKVPQAHYTSVLMPNDPASQEQVTRLFNDVVRSIDAGWPVIINIVAPPNNPPAAIASMGSKSPPYPKFLTTYHYMVLAGYLRKPSMRGFWVADPASFGGVTGWWAPLEGPGSISSLIPPKGYCFADCDPVDTEPVDGGDDEIPVDTSEPGYSSTSIYRRPNERRYSLAEMIISIDGMRHRETVEEAARFGDLDAIDRIAQLAAGAGAITDEWALSHARAVLETIHTQYLENYTEWKKATDA